MGPARTVNTPDEPAALGPPDLSNATFRNEADALAELVPLAAPRLDEGSKIDDLARRFVHAARAGRKEQGGIDAFLVEYGLSTEEGVILMCLAESLLRIPDAATADDLIDDKIPHGDWKRHLGGSGSLLVNASTWGLLLTGQVIALKEGRQGAAGLLGRLIGRTGEPMIRRALRQAMRIMGDQFVLGRHIGEALGRAKAKEALGYRYSYDMLGEGARTAEDAERYLPQAKGVAIIPLSARSGAGVDKLLAAVEKVYEAWNSRVPTAKLNQWLQWAVEQHSPPAASGRTIRLRFMTQASARPPTFVAFCSRPDALPAYW